jgi:membrane protein DedA with SNARE-associated domain
MGVAVSSLIYDLVVVGLGFAARSGLQGVEERLRIYIIMTVIIVMLVMWVVFWLAFQRR